MEYDVKVTQLLDNEKRVLECSVNGVKGENISCGCRDVFRCRDVVIKFDRANGSCANTYTQSMTTPERYAQFKAEDRKYIPRLLAHGEIEGRHYIIEEWHDLDWSPLTEEEKITVKDVAQKYGLWDTGHNTARSKRTGDLLIYDYAL